MVGPTAWSHQCRDPEVSMNATCATVMPPFGGAGFVSQSGAMGLRCSTTHGGIRDRHRTHSSCWKNKADVSGNDFFSSGGKTIRRSRPLNGTSKNFGNPDGSSKSHHESHAGNRLSRSSQAALPAGARQRHPTGALAASDSTVDALLAQAGVLRAGSVASCSISRCIRRTTVSSHGSAGRGSYKRRWPRNSCRRCSRCSGTASRGAQARNS